MPDSIQTSADELRWSEIQKWIADTGQEHLPLFSPLVETSDPQIPTDTSIDTIWATRLRLVANTEDCPHAQWLESQARLIDTANQDRFEPILNMPMTARVALPQNSKKGYGPIYEIVRSGHYAWDTKLEQVVSDRVYWPDWYPAGFDRDTLRSGQRNQRKMRLMISVTTVTWILILQILVEQNALDIEITPHVALRWLLMNILTVIIVNIACTIAGPNRHRPPQT
jgi:hypothetical protein